MTCRLSNFAILLTLALGGSFLLVHSTPAAERGGGKPIEFSDRKPDEVTTNLNQMGSRKAGLQQLEDDLGKPFQTFKPGSSLDGVFTPPMRQPAGPSVPSKRARELMEKQKNWIFMTPEDLGGATKEEDIFKMREYDKDGREKKERSPLERFMEREQDEKNPNKKRKESKDTDFLTEFGKRKDRKGDFKSDYDDSSLPQSLRDSEQSLKKLFDTDGPSSFSGFAPSGNGLSDVFGLGNATALKPLAENPNIAKYRQMLDTHSSPPPTDPFGSFSGASSLNSMDSLSQHRDSFSPIPSLGTIGLPTTPGLFDSKSLNPAPAPRVDPPRMMPAPTFAVPQRKFQ